MRYLLTILCFFTAINSFAQEIELQGRFGASFLGAESINFVGKDSFYFDGFYCVNGVRGKGRCEIRDNMLYLYFEKSPKRKDLNRPQVVEMHDNKDQVAELTVTCFDKDSMPISFGSVELGKAHGTRVGKTLDTSGKAIFKINRVDLPLVLVSSAVGFELKEVRINKFADYNIRIFHNDNMGIKELNSGEIRSYEIDELSEDLIVMRSAKSTGEFRRYTKRKANQNTR